MAEAASVTLAEFTELLSAGAGVRITPDLVGDGTTFDEIGVDSLALLGVIPILERTRQILLPNDAENIKTVSDFLDLVNDIARKAGLNDGTNREQRGHQGAVGPGLVQDQRCSRLA
jgi:minimal PKS acyl carrier protein